MLIVKIDMFRPAISQKAVSGDKNHFTPNKQLRYSKTKISIIILQDSVLTAQ